MDSIKTGEITTRESLRGQESICISTFARQNTAICCCLHFSLFTLPVITSGSYEIRSIVERFLRLMEILSLETSATGRFLFLSIYKRTVISFGKKVNNAFSIFALSGGVLLSQ